MYNLAHIYFYGEGVETDFVKAKDLLVVSSKKNFMSSKILLCLLLIKKVEIVDLNCIKNEIQNDELALELYQMITHFNIINTIIYQYLFNFFLEIEFFYNILKAPIIFNNYINKNKNASVKNKKNTVEINQYFYEGLGKDIVTMICF